MNYKLIIEPEADNDLERHIRAGNKKLLKKIYQLFEELKQHPETGTGKPEPLKEDRAGQWSRRISDKHRLVYKIEENKVIVLMLSSGGHYDDK